MQTAATSKIVKERRDYNSWVATETLEDYALRFAPKSFRKWSEWLVANTAIGGISFLALEAIGGSLAISYGFANSFWAIVVVGGIIFLAGLPITYYASKYNIDMDLLTRGAGFGYIGSTITSLIYASFTFIFFALEAAIMAQALELYYQLPLEIGYIICSLVIIPLVFFGVTLINQLQLWTQPIWLILMVIPYICVLHKEPTAFSDWLHFAGRSPSGATFDPLLFGSAATVSFSLIAQLGEQVDYLRFLPDKQHHNQRRWWLAVILAGPGWIILGGAKQLGGAFLASLVVNHGISLAKANEPTQMYLAGFNYVFANPEVVLAVTILFVVISQIKINVTNAYAGSLAWSNFFSRLTHSHPGRVIWLVFNVAIALLLMELGVFSTLEAVLGLYSNVAIAWVGALVADLVINKPLGISPSYIEFKRAHLYNINPVGFGSMLIASVVAIIAFVGGLGPVAQAFAPFIALSLAFVLAPVIAVLTKGKYYIARQDIHFHHLNTHTSIACCICEQKYEHQDMAYCPVYDGSICSLCCSLDARCHDACKSDSHHQLLRAIAQTVSKTIFQGKLSPQLGVRMLKYLAVFLSLACLVGALFALVYYQQVAITIASPATLASTLLEIYAALVVLLGMGSWWLVLTQESRELAQEELDKQNLQLQQEVKERQLAEAQLQEKAQQLEQTLHNLKQAEAHLIQTEKMVALGGLVAGIAHEVNTPVGIGVTAASLLVEKTKAFSEVFHQGSMKRSDLEKFLDTALRSSTLTLANLNRAAELIQSFKQVAVDQSSEARRVFNLTTYLKEVLLQLSPKLKSANHVIQLHGEPDLTINSYPGVFSQIITNLLLNSLNHAYDLGEQGLITISVQPQDEHLLLEYSDDGKGIAVEHLNRIFEPFFTTKRGQGGSGLGLHIVYNLVTQKLGGTIHCSSQPGVGAKFIIVLPIASDDDSIA
ncbi:ATP-binding protein [Pantanalinema sp. GBBB05]|uniref:ATP-binding protein n=1 Tax=Pantanalinema sp. GBBB05 TaxID=2604139 RepID=UPI001D67E431|nr:histidine kinase [Pantanalinema sp. GBBB05]